MVTIEEIQAGLLHGGSNRGTSSSSLLRFEHETNHRKPKSQLFTQLASMFLHKELLTDIVELLNLKWTDFDDVTRKYDSGVNPEHDVKEGCQPATTWSS